MGDNSIARESRLPTACPEVEPRADTTAGRIARAPERTAGTTPLDRSGDSAWRFAIVDNPRVQRAENPVAHADPVLSETRCRAGLIKIALMTAGKEVGTISVDLATDGSAQATDLRVSPAERGKGHGSVLLAAAARATPDQQRLRLDSGDDGSGRLDKWYQSQGMQRTGQRADGFSTFEAPPAALGPSRIRRSSAANSTVVSDRAIARTSTSQLRIQRMKRAGEPPRRRESTQKKTKESEAGAFAGPRPAERRRRPGTEYVNVDRRANLGPEMAKRALLEQAIRDGQVWDGLRDSVNWQGQFAPNFWNHWDDGHANFVCAVGGDECTRLVLAPGHVGLEIGHIQGFYRIVSDVDPEERCDGTTHWELKEKQKVIEANQMMDNLEPQCGKCNREPKQQRKDPRGGGLDRPKETGSCPGEGCAVKRL